MHEAVPRWEQRTRAKELPLSQAQLDTWTIDAVNGDAEDLWAERILTLIRELERVRTIPPPESPA